MLSGKTTTLKQQRHACQVVFVVSVCDLSAVIAHKQPIALCLLYKAHIIGLYANCHILVGHVHSTNALNSEQASIRCTLDMEIVLSVRRNRTRTHFVWK